MKRVHDPEVITEKEYRKRQKTKSSILSFENEKLYNKLMDEFDDHDDNDKPIEHFIILLKEKIKKEEFNALVTKTSQVDQKETVNGLEAKNDQLKRQIDGLMIEKTRLFGDVKRTLTELKEAKEKLEPLKQKNRFYKDRHRRVRPIISSIRNIMMMFPDLQKKLENCAQEE